MIAAVVVGNPKPQSRTLQAAQLVVERLTGRPADLTLDLVDFGAALLDWTAEPVAVAVEQVRAVNLLVVASPTYKGTFTGLLKLFLDRFSSGSLTDVTVVPLMLGGDWRHSMAPEVFLKPVLAELGASMPTRGLFLLDADSETRWANAEAMSNWLDLARRQLRGVLAQGAVA